MATDYGNGGSGHGMPGDQPFTAEEKEIIRRQGEYWHGKMVEHYAQTQERSDRTPGGTNPEDVRRIVGQSGGVSLYATRGYTAIERDGFPLRPGLSVPRSRHPGDHCLCSHLTTQKARTHEGPHHDEGCPLWQLPDYGVFQPDE